MTLEEVPKKDEKVEVLEVDELCVNFKKYLALDRSRARHEAACRLYLEARLFFVRVTTQHFAHTLL